MSLDTEELAEELVKVSKHLEFLDYSVEPSPPSILSAEHETHVNLQIVDVANGFLLLSLYQESPKATADRKGYLEFINKLNCENQMLTWGTNENGLFAQGLYFGGYDKETFGAFLEAYNSEVEGNELLLAEGYVGS